MKIFAQRNLFHSVNGFSSPYPVHVLPVPSLLRQVICLHSIGCIIIHLPTELWKWCIRVNDAAFSVLIILVCGVMQVYATGGRLSFVCSGTNNVAVSTG